MEVLPVERLGDVVEGAARQAALGQRHVAGAADDDHRQLGPPQLHLLQHLDAAEPRHPEIQQHDVGPLVLGQHQAIAPVVGAYDHVAGVPEVVDDHLDDVGVVVDDQDPAQGLRGHVKVFIASEAAVTSHEKLCRGNPAAAA